MGAARKLKICSSRSLERLCAKERGAVVTWFQATRGSGSSSRPSRPPLLEQRWRARLQKLPLLDLAVWGASVGTILDEIHAKADVLRYNQDLGGVKWEALRDSPVIGDPSTSYTVLQTSLFVPALLAAFYVVDGSLYLLLCEEEERRLEPEQLSEVVVRLGALGVMLQISALLYENYVPYEKMRWVLGALALANWAIFDKRLKTPYASDKVNAFKSLGLAVFAGVAAPLIETVLIDPLHLWYYPRPDVLGLNSFPSWVPFCYIFYHPFLFSLARYLQDKKDAIGG